MSQEFGPLHFCLLIGVVFGATIGLAVLVHLTVIVPQSADSFMKAEFDLQKINSCDTLIVFNSNIDHYDLTTEDTNHLHNTISQKMESLKCP